MQLVRTNTGISFKNILFLTDFSEASSRALGHALAVARHFQARLYPAYVVEPTAAQFGNTESIQELEIRKRQQLARQVEYNGIGFQPLISRCDFESAIPHWIAEYGIDLIVMGTHGRRGMQRFLLGSTSEWVVRNALCPVLTVGPYIRTPRLFSLSIDNILCATALDRRSSDEFLNYALCLAQERRARLILLHVLPEESREYRDRSRILRFTLEQLQNLLPADASDLCRPELAVDAGDPAERILFHAQNEEPDLIVMGLPRKKDHNGGMGTGVTYRVISSAPCAVLTIPEAQRE
jgi:nucleotide-binding universal stress UspA family protein